MNLSKFFSTLILASLTYYLISEEEYDFILFDGFLWAFVFILDVIGFVAIFTEDFGKYRISKNLSSFVSTYICLLFIGIIVVKYNLVEAKSNRPFIILLSYDGDINGVNIKLYSDSTYRYENMSIGGTDFSYGKYSMQDSTINLLSPTKGISNNRSFFKIKKNENKSIAVVVDKFHNELYPNLTFEVIDKR